MRNNDKFFTSKDFKNTAYWFAELVFYLVEDLKFSYNAAIFYVTREPVAIYRLYLKDKYKGRQKYNR